MNKLKYPPTYKHDPAIEPRPYWRYDRFASRLSGYVHDRGFATDIPYERESQLMAGYVATPESHAEDCARYQRAKKRRKAIMSGAVQRRPASSTLNEPTRKPKRKKIKKKIKRKGGRVTNETKATKGKKARRPAPKKAKLKRKGQG